MNACAQGFDLAADGVLLHISETAHPVALGDCCQDNEPDHEITKSPAIPILYDSANTTT